MARILITTFGSSGDLNPFVALGLGLQARGWDVAFAVEDDFRSVLYGAGFGTIHRLSGSIDPESVLPESSYRSSFPFRSVKAMVTGYLVPTLERRIQELVTAGAYVDLIVAPSAHFAASIASEVLSIPWVSINLSPVSIPSEEIKPHPWPPPLPARLQRVANRAQWSFAERALRSIADEPINEIRERHGLSPRRNLLTVGNLSTDLAAVAVSPALMPEQADWPSGLHATGFCFWDTPRRWAAGDELRAFFAGPEPVVAISSGSISPRIGQVFSRFYAVSIEAVRRAGARALIVGAPPGSLPESLPDDVLALPFVPFSAIYPRCAAVIHHGGIGTTAQALRAGVPALVVPWGFDQYFTAAQVLRIGAGRWLSRRAYTPGRAARALRSLFPEDSSDRLRAGAIAAQIGREDGVATLCSGIELLLTGEGSMTSRGWRPARGPNPGYAARGAAAGLARSSNGSSESPVRFKIPDDR